MKNKLINHILFYCGNFKKHEKLLVIYDNQSKHVFFEFKKFLNRKKVIFDSNRTTNFHLHGKNLGKKIEQKMLNSNLVLCLTENSFAHSKERLLSEKRCAIFKSCELCF